MTAESMLWKRKIETYSVYENISGLGGVGEKMAMRRETAPAEGERRAIGGYYPQYRISASLILRGLHDGSLHWIRIADPEADRVDDFQIGRQSRVDAFQVKWSRFPSSFTFKQLSTSTERKPSIISQLAKGWIRLQDLYPSKRIVVHLIANDTPSTNDELPIDDSAHKIGSHFAQFIETVWREAKKQLSLRKLYDVPDGWKKAWKSLQESSGLSKEIFSDFIRDCELEFRYDLPKFDQRLSEDAEIAEKDLEHITQILFSAVARPDKIIELTRDELLSELGWTERLEFKSRHEFSVDEKLYQPIDDVLYKFKDAINKLSGGYIAVIGTPGSGKSTFLTQTLRHCHELVIRYYAYVPDAQDPRTLRGESVNFLHDVVLEIEHAGFRVGESLSYFDRAQLLTRFHEQLNLLHQDWRHTGRKTIILIDGLDHIEREQKPNRSLIDDLPSPDQVPEGIYIVLGSQTDIIFPDRIKASVQRPSCPCREIEMQSLSRESVIKIIERMKLPAILSSDQKEKIFSLSDGHPLALMYILNNLREVRGSEDLPAILDGIEPFRGNIEEQYYTYWSRNFCTDYDLSQLLGRLSRLRGAIDLSWVEKWSDRSVVNRLRKQAAHYFKHEDSNHWYFFHNSFRIFLNQKTAESSPGVFDSSIDRTIHKELAKICAQDLGDEPWSWDELYHWALAEEHEEVLGRATQDWFRNQFYAFRPADAIKADIRLAMTSAIACKDLVAFCRILLISAEIDDRASYLENVKIIPLLLAIDEAQIAIEYMRDGNRLRIEPMDALKLCGELISVGKREEARRIFDLAEPLDILSESKPTKDIHHDDNIKLLEAWAESAGYFHSMDEIIHTIRGISREKDEIRQIDALTATHELQNRLRFLVGCTLLDANRWDDFELILNLYDPSNERDKKVWFWLQAHAWEAYARSGDKSRAANLINEIIDKTDTSDLDAESCVFLAEGVYRFLGDAEKAKDLLKHVPQSEPKIDSYVSDRLSQFYHRFRLIRLLYSLGDERSPNEIIHDPHEDRERGMVLFERSLCIIARIWSNAWLKKHMDVGVLKKEFLPLLHIFDRHDERPQESVSWYATGGVRIEFYSLLINAVNLHEPKATESLREEFELAWNNSETSIFWPTGTRRQIMLELNDVSQNRRWLIDSLTSLEEKMLNDKDISGRIEECIEQAEAWASLDEKESVHRILEKMLKTSFGVGYRKDYQFNIWINWLNRTNKIEPEKASERIEWFARAIVSLESTTEGRASTYAANDLLLVSFRWSPKSAVSLFRWFIDQRVIVHEEAFCILLKEALKADNSVAQIALYSLFDFILPIAINAYPDISELIIEKAALEGDCNSIKNAKYMLDKLKIYALPSTRSTWYNGISHAIKENGLNLSCQEIDGHPHQPDKEQEASSSKLKLNDGSCLRLEEVGKQVTSIKILINLLNREQAESYFNWSPVIERLVEDMDLEEMRELAGLYEGKQYSANVYSIISKRLLDLNYSDDAWDIGLKSLGASRPGGWDRQYDGGSRLFAFKALIQTDPKKGRSILWNTLERDLDDASWLSQRLLFNLEELLSLMSDDPPFKETWNEIEHYVHMLFEPRQLPEYNLRHSQQRISMHPSSRAIADLLAVHLNHPVNIVSQSSRQACAKLLMRDDLEIQNALRELLMEDESYQEAILMVLDAISIQFPDSIKIFSKEIQNRYQSSNYAIRRISQTLGARIGLDAANTEDNKKPKLELVYLPLIYQLHIPRVPNSSRKLEISDNKPLPDTNDPFEIISPFEFQIELIAREAALSEINVCYRAIEIMRELGSSYSWSEEDERDLRVTLESARLCFTFHRPRPQLVRRAIYHIVSELSDVGLLDTKNLCNLNPFLRFYDTFMVLAEPISRPNYILPLAWIDKYGDKSEIWAKKVSEAKDSCAFRAADDLLILAEKTTLKRLAWENPSEIRRSIVCLTEASDVSSYEEHQTFFHHEINVAVSDYFDLLPQLDPNPLIILNESRGYDSPGENWLALNPMIARQLGWNLSKDGLFRWINDKGEVMVESIWWSDGFIGQHPPHFDDEVGEGWLVIASQNALYALKSEFNNLRRMVNVERNFYKNGRQVKFDAQHEFSI